MIPFRKLDLNDRTCFEAHLARSHKAACEYSFANIYLWGRKKIAEQDGFLLVQSQFDRKHVYLFPVGAGDLKGALDAIIRDAAARGIPCCLAALTQRECEWVEQLYPGRFRFHCDRDSYDYIYAVEDLSELKGRKYQKKRNHLNRFRQNHPDAQILPLDEENLTAAFLLAQQWYQSRQSEDPDHDYYLEHLALQRAFAFYKQLGMEGVVLMEQGRALAFAMGTRLNDDTFDIHFEKALDAVDGTYAAINQGFACYLRDKHPELKWLNREDDLGIEGLRQAKLSYYPDHMVEKCWAQLREAEDGF